MSSAPRPASTLFKQSYNSSRPFNYGSVMIEVESLDSKDALEKSHPGTVTGKVMSGTLAGQSITFSLRDSGTNSNALKVEDLQKKTSKSHTPPGGVIHVENLTKDGDKFTVSWMNRMSVDPTTSPVIAGEITRIAPVTKRNANGVHEVRKGTNGATLYRASVLHSSETVAAESIEVFEKAVLSAFNNEHGAKGDLGAHGVLLVAIRNGDNGLEREHLSATRYAHGEGIVSPEKALANLYGRASRDDIANIFASGGKVDVIPTSTYFIGGKTAQMVDDKIESGPSAHPPVDVPRFKMANDKYGFARASLALKHYTDENGDPQTGVFVNRAYGATKPVPLHAVATKSDPEATSRYYNHLKESAAPAKDDAGTKAPSTQSKEHDKVAADGPVESKTEETLESKSEEQAQAAAVDGFESILDEIGEDDFDIGNEPDV